MTNTPIGARLRTLREATGHSRGHVAQRLHVVPSSISNWEHGHRQPTFETVEKYCHAIGLTVHIGPAVAQATEIEEERP